MSLNTMTSFPVARTPESFHQDAIENETVESNQPPIQISKQPLNRGHKFSQAVAPMVNQSDAPFRVLCLRHGATCAYTEMLYSHLVVEDEQYLDGMIPEEDVLLEIDAVNEMNDIMSFSTGIVGYEAVVDGDGDSDGCEDKNPRTQDLEPGPRSRSSLSPEPRLVIQLCGNDPDIVGRAVLIIISREEKQRLLRRNQARRIYAIDLNLGCPQDRAKTGLFGSYLLDKCHWPRVFDCVRAMKAALPSSIPLFCKIRICDGGICDKLCTTVKFCEGLAAAGASMICIHGRNRGSARLRRCGPADIKLVGEIARQLCGVVPVVSNGNIINQSDIAATFDLAPLVQGVMSAEGILAYPALFMDSSRFSHSQPDRHSLFEEYCELSKRYDELGAWSKVDRMYVARTSEVQEPRQMFIARQHLTWMLEKEGHGRTVRFRHVGSYSKQVHLLNALKDAKTLDELLLISSNCLRTVRESPSYEHDDWRKHSMTV